MKVCHRCKEEKPHPEFNKNVARKDGLASTCRSCMKVYRKAHYQKNRESYIVDIMDRRARNKAVVVEALYAYLSERNCVDCGNSDQRVLEFDHRDPAAKSYNVSSMICEGYGWDKILSEIEKCDIRCANCHRIRTQTQFGSFRALWVTNGPLE